jgi:hypothetical protein
MDARPVSGNRLTIWAATPDGASIELSLKDEAGRNCAISLPNDDLSALMMIITCMIRRSLAARSADRSLRMTHPLGDRRVERHRNRCLDSQPVDADSFEIVFAVAADQAERLGEMLRHSANPTATLAAVIN